MYKAHRPQNNTDSIFFDNKRVESPYIIEIGHSTPPKGYTSQRLNRNVYVLHYVLRGQGRYYDYAVNGPCVFLETPNTVHYYEVDSDPQAPEWEQYWIMFTGNNVEAWLADAGFPNAPVCLPCPYMEQAQKVFQSLLKSSYLLKIENYSHLNTRTQK